MVLENNDRQVLTIIDYSFGKKQSHSLFFTASKWNIQSAIWELLQPAHWHKVSACDKY